MTNALQQGWTILLVWWLYQLVWEIRDGEEYEDD